MLKSKLLLALVCNGYGLRSLAVDPVQDNDEFFDTVNMKLNNKNISTNRLHRSDKKQSINTLAKQKAKRKYEISSKLHPLLNGFSK
jgi:hypothetical protein